MILRLTAGQLRKLADQLDAYTALEAADADHFDSRTVMKVDGAKLAYLHWWQDKRCYIAEFIDFTPNGHEPLAYHQSTAAATDAER